MASNEKRLFNQEEFLMIRGTLWFALPRPWIVLPHQVPCPSRVCGWLVPVPVLPSELDPSLGLFKPPTYLNLDAVFLRIYRHLTNQPGAHPKFVSTLPNYTEAYEWLTRRSQKWLELDDYLSDEGDSNSDDEAMAGPDEWEQCLRAFFRTDREFSAFIRSTGLMYSQDFDYSRLTECLRGWRTAGRTDDIPEPRRSEPPVGASTPDQQVNNDQGKNHDRQDETDGDKNKKDGKLRPSAVPSIQDDLDTLSAVLESLFQVQPKATQLVLTQQAGDMFQIYGQHGCASRLSDAVMHFINDGGEAIRNGFTNVVKRHIAIDPVTGLATPKDVTVTVQGKERTILKFEPVPMTDTDRARVRQGVSHDLKETHKDQDGLIVGFRHTRSVLQEELREIAVRDPVKIALDEWKAQGSNAISAALETANNAWPPRNTGDFEFNMNASGSNSTAIKNNGDSMDVDTEDVVAGPSSFMARSEAEKTTAHGVTLQATDDAMQIDSNDATVDDPTVKGKDKVVDTNTIITDMISHIAAEQKFAKIPPLEALLPTRKIARDISTTPTNQNAPFHPVSLRFVIPRGAVFPKNTLSHINNVLRLHNLSAQDLLRYFIIKNLHVGPLPHISYNGVQYTINTRTLPSLPPPAIPFALLRLGIAQRFISQFATLIGSSNTHDLRLSPGARTTLRSVYDRVKSGRLNYLEIELLRRVTMINRPGNVVERFWEGRSRDLRAWRGVKIWRLVGEVVQLREARKAGLY